MKINSVIRQLGLLLLVGTSGIAALYAQTKQLTEDQLKAQTFYYQGVLEAKQERWHEAHSLLDYSYRLDSTSTETMYELGRVCMALDQLQRGLELLRKAHRLEPQNRDYIEGLMMGLEASHANEEAIQIARDWLSKHPEDEYISMRLGQAYLNSGTIDSAIRVYNRLQQTKTKDLPAFMRLAYIKARIHGMASRDQEAMGEYRRVVETFPHELEPKAQYASQLLERRMLSELPELLKTLEQEDYEAMPLALLQIAYYSAAQHPDSAIQVLKRIDREHLASGGDQINIWYSFLQEQRGKTLLIPQQYNHHLDSLLALHPEDLRLVLGYAKILRQQAQYRKAIQVQLPFVEVEPQNVELWDGIIGDAVSAEDNKLVEELSLKAIEHIQTNWRYYLFACIGLREEPEQAMALARRGLQELPSSETWGRSILLGLLGDYLLEQGRVEESFKHYEEAIELEPNNPSVLNNYAYALVERDGDLDKAERMAANAVRLQPKDVNALDTFAWIYYKQGRYTMARLYQTEALTVAGKDASPVLYDHMGDIKHALGDIGAAREAWGKALELYTQEGEHEKAKLVSDKLKGKPKQSKPSKDKKKGKSK